MSAVFRSLGPGGEVFHTSCEPDTSLWNFSEKNIPKNRDEKVNFLRPLIHKQQLLHTEYDLYCTQLATDITNKQKPKTIEQLIPQIQTALMMSEILEQLDNPDYLNVPEKIKKLHLEQTIYRDWLTQLGFQFPEKMQNIALNTIPVNITIRHLTSQMGWGRNFSLRIRQLLITILRTFNDAQNSLRWIAFMEEFSKPIVAYFVWLFYVPRLFSELFFTIKHTLPHPWMGPQEYALGWLTRLQAQWYERWFFITHDATWLSGGLVNCFVMIGALAPISVYIICLLHAFDVVLASIHGHIEITRLQTIRREYLTARQQTTVEEEQESISDYIQHIDRRLAYEQRYRDLRMGSNAFLVLSLALACPIILLHPLFPFVGALISVLTTLVTYFALDQLEKNKPKSGHSIVSISLFKPKQENNISLQQQAEASAYSQCISLEANNTLF